MGAPGTTPGEWSTTGTAEGSEFEVRAGDKYVCACPFDTEPFAPVPPYSEARANAAQCAASPDLYDALVYVRENLGEPVPVGRRHVARIVDAALAKARGE